MWRDKTNKSREKDRKSLKNTMFLTLIHLWRAMAVFAFPAGAGSFRARCSGGFRCRCSHSGVGSPNSEGALWKQSFVENGMCGGENNVVGGVHGPCLVLFGSNTPSKHHVVYWPRNTCLGSLIAVPSNYCAPIRVA